MGVVSCRVVDLVPLGSRQSGLSAGSPTSDVEEVAKAEDKVDTAMANSPEHRWDLEARDRAALGGSAGAGCQQGDSDTSASTSGICLRS
jgi:hypothetical protein